MQSAVGSLLLVSSVVLLSCIIVGYTADLAAHILENPQSIAATALHELQKSVNNQTINDFFDFYSNQPFDGLNHTAPP